MSNVEELYDDKEIFMIKYYPCISYLAMTFT